MINMAAIIQAVRPGPWLPITLHAGFTAHAGSYPPSARIVNGDTVELCGQLDGTISTGGAIIGTVDPTCQPAENCRPTLYLGDAIAGTLGVSTAGTLTAHAAATETTACLDGITYRLI